MDVEFCMQDPTDPNTRYLFEAIVEAVENASTWRGMYAFATKGGVNQLIADPAVDGFLRRGGPMEFIVGIDAITNRQTLERMQELEARHPSFKPRVFWNTTTGLFHPKISHFTYEGGRRRLIVGSGNLTPGGLTHNFEAYSVIDAARRDALDLTPLDAFIARHAANIRPIDREALERAGLNVIRPIAGVRPVRVPPIPHQPGQRPAALPPTASGRVLIAQVPAAGGRWSQVHFNADIITLFFRVTNINVQRVYLTRIGPGGVRGEEEVRPVVYSNANKNHKIEIAAAKGLEYPTVAPPILVFLERQVRVFDYVLLMPDDAGYATVAALLKSLPAIGKGMHRAITDESVLAQAWPTNPLVVAANSAPMEL